LNSSGIKETTADKRLSILLLCDDWPGQANTVHDHINAFTRYSRHQVRTFNPTRMSRSVALDFDEFDVVVIHYSLVLSNEHHVSDAFRDKLRRFRGLKVQFMQDEYRWVDRATAASRDAGIQVLFTAAPDPAAGQLYDQRLPGVRRVETLTGYVPDNLQKLPLSANRLRSIDVGYRGRDLPFWLGRLTQEKVWIAQGFLERAPKYALRCDIGWRERDRIYGSRWIEFMASCRATLGTESGASIADFDGSVERAVRAYFRAYPAATYDEVHGAVLEPYEGNVVVSVISPRVFEAVSLGTALVMFPGKYSGILAPGEDYIVLEKDFSNMDEVVAQLQDDSLMAALTKRAHDRVIKSGRWSYASFIAGFDQVVVEEAQTVRGPSRALRHRLASAERSLRVPPIWVRLYGGVFAALSAATGSNLSKRAAKDPESVDKGLMAMRAALGDGELRPLFLEGRRAGLALDRLLEEILELSLLRQAMRGRLQTRDKFVLTSEFDAANRSLRFVSRPVDESRPQESGSPKAVLDALRAQTLDTIEWDHREVGRTVPLRSPRVEVGIGADGIETFALLAQIGRRNPDALARALTPMITANVSGAEDVS
jgi:hypothetical protein